MKIDTTLIENYDTLSDEEKLKAILDLDFEPQGYVQKSLFDAKVSELSKSKKNAETELKAVKTETTSKDTLLEELKSKVAMMEKQNKVSEYTAKYLKQGYSEELATSTANALVDGDMDTVFANSETFNEELKKSVNASVLKSTPRPVGNSENTGMSKENFDKMSLPERLKWANEHKEEYEEMNKE